jgi:hypothetical protein
MTQAIHPALDQDLIERRGKVPKATIQVPPHTRDYLDKIKEQSGVDTYGNPVPDP